MNFVFLQFFAKNGTHTLCAVQFEILYIEDSTKWVWVLGESIAISTWNMSFWKMSWKMSVTLLHVKSTISKKELEEGLQIISEFQIWLDTNTVLLLQQKVLLKLCLSLLYLKASLQMEEFSRKFEISLHQNVGSKNQSLSSPKHINFLKESISKNREDTQSMKLLKSSILNTLASALKFEGDNFVQWASIRRLKLCSNTCFSFISTSFLSIMIKEC